MTIKKGHQTFFDIKMQIVPRNFFRFVPQTGCQVSGRGEEGDRKDPLSRFLYQDLSVVTLNVAQFGHIALQIDFVF